MADEMKLREVCIRYNIPRRAIQGYEKMGLIKPYKRTSIGHLVYDSDTVNKIVFIRHLQNIGYSLKEVTELLTLNSKALAVELNNSIQSIQDKQNKLSQLEEKTAEIIIAFNNGHDLDDEIRCIITGGNNNDKND